VLGPQQETRRCLITNLQSLPLFPFYSISRSASSVRHGPRNYLLLSHLSRSLSVDLCCLQSALGKAARAAAPRGTATLRPFPSLLLPTFFTFISYWILFVYLSIFRIFFFNCREWRMDIPFKDVVFDTSDPHGSALSLLPLLFPDRKINDMRISALTQGTTNGVSIPSY
jgi:hypothetical protein